MFFSFSSFPRPSQPRAGGPARVIRLRILWHRTVCYFVSFSLLCILVCLLFVIRFQLGTSPPRGTAGCPTFPFRVGFRRFISPTATLAVHGRVLTLVSLITAPAFSFNRLSSSLPPRHAGGSRKGFDGGFPCHSAWVFLQLLFFRFFLAS